MIAPHLVNREDGWNVVPRRGQQRHAADPKGIRVHVQVLAETVEDLVDASPAASIVDGSLILGSKDTTLLVLDALTGELIEEMAALGGRIMQIADLFGEWLLRCCSCEPYTVQN